MSFLDKLKFWQKHDDFNLGEKEHLPGENDLGLPELDMQRQPEEPEAPSFQQGMPPSFRPQNYPQAQQQPLSAYQQPQMVQQSSPQLELINSKLDAIKAMLSVLEQKMVNLERMSGHEKKYW